MSGPYHRYAPIERAGLYDGQLDPPDLPDCICPEDMPCCECRGSKNFCTCPPPAAAEEDDG